MDPKKIPAYSKLTPVLALRQLEFCTILFRHISGGNTDDPESISGFFKAAEQTFGSYDILKSRLHGCRKVFIRCGWAICYEIRE